MRSISMVFILSLALGCVASTEPAIEDGPTTAGTLNVSCLGLIVDDDPLLAHSPPFFDDAGNVLHRCELYLQVETPNNSPVIRPAYMRFFAEGRHWLGGRGYFSGGSFDFPSAYPEDCPDCETRAARGEFTYCDLRNAQGCAFEGCRIDGGGCAQQAEAGLSKTLEIDFVPQDGMKARSHEIDMRMLSEGQPTECRALRDPSTNALQIEFQLGTFNGIEVTDLFGPVCAAEQVSISRFRFRMGGVTGPGAFGPSTSVMHNATRLPSIDWDMPYSFVATRVPPSDACDDHGRIELDDNSSCTLDLGNDSLELTCERALFWPAEGEVFPAVFIPYWGVTKPPLMRGRFRLAGDCDYREKAR